MNLTFYDKISKLKYPFRDSYWLFLIIFLVIPITKDSLVFAFEKDVVSVKDFGAKGDGVIDDIAAFELAIKNLKEWETLYIPNGVYRISRPFTILNKHRIKIRSDGVLKPHDNFVGDYLVEFINKLPDEIIPSMGMNIVVDNLTIDCEWKTRGVLFDGVYDFSVRDLHVWRPFGHGIKIRRAQEGSFWKPVIFAGKDRIFIDTKDVEDWDPKKAYKSGEKVKVNFPPFNHEKSYKKGDIVNYENRLYRSLEDFNTGKKPSDNPTSWEWVHFEYFIATDLPGNINKNPNSYTARNPDKSKRYWRPFYPTESALEIISEGDMDTIDNIKFFNLIIRSSANNPLIRIDNHGNPLKPLKIEFYASQIHIITEQYINAFNKKINNVNQYGGKLTNPDHLILIHVPNSFGLKFIGGNIQLGRAPKSKAFQFGTLDKKGDPGSGNTAMTFLNSFSIEGTGFGQVGISILPSVRTQSKWFQNGVFINLNGESSTKIIDIDNELRAFKIYKSPAYND